MLLEVITQYQSIVGGAIAGGAVLASGLASWLTGKHQAKQADKRQQKYILEQMAQQNQYNIDAFNRENAYNHPSAQAQRAYEAGLNPNWVDGLGAIGQQDSGVSGSFNSHVADSLNLDVAGAINAYNQFRQTKSQIDVNKSVEARNKAEEKLLQTQEVTERSRPANLESSTNLNNSNAGLANQQTVDLQQTLDARIKSLESQSALNVEQQRELQLTRELRLEQMRQQIKYLKDTIDIEEKKLAEQKRKNDLDYKVGMSQVSVGHEANQVAREGHKLNYNAQMAANAISSTAVSNLGKLQRALKNKITLEAFHQVIENEARQFVRDNNWDVQLFEKQLHKYDAEIDNLYRDWERKGYDNQWLEETLKQRIFDQNFFGPLNSHLAIPK